MKTHALLTVNQSGVEFKLQNMPYNDLQITIEYLKHKVPGMKWDQEAKVWRLPIWKFQKLYEQLRGHFSAEQIDLQWQLHHTMESPQYQLPLEF